jgi:hypothetical protein
LTTFFKYTTVAANAFYGDFTFKGYYNFGFHLDALTSFVCHALRAVYNLVNFALRVVVTPFYIANPFVWLDVPEHFMSLVDHATASVISLLTVAIHPIVAVMRTLTSLLRGYEEDTDYDGGLQEEEERLALATTIFPPAI